jgi:hypothetical protein
MHGGFENETPNIPTNTIVKLDLGNLFKGNATLTSKLEQFTGRKEGSSGPSSRPGSTTPTDGSSAGSRTPPSGGSKSPTIRFDAAQIVEAPG